MLNTKVKEKFKPFSAFDYEPRFVQKIELFGLVPTWELPILRFKASFAGDYYPSFVDKLKAMEKPLPVVNPYLNIESIVNPLDSANAQPENNPSPDFKIDLSKLEMSRSALGHFLMSYKDANGSVTSREIALKKVFRKGDVMYLSAYCRLRKSIKNFRVDRIITLEDLDNNMVFDTGFDVIFAVKFLAA